MVRRGCGTELIESHLAAFRRTLGRRSGVYVLHRRDGIVYYVGLATRLRSRLRRHLVDRHRGKWHRFSFYAVRPRFMKDVETVLLRVSRPTGNKVIGKFKKGRNLKKRLKSIVEQDLKEMLG